MEFGTRYQVKDPILGPEGLKIEMTLGALFKRYQEVKGESYDSGADLWRGRDKATERKRTTLKSRRTVATPKTKINRKKK